jgi:hypothetical protein
MTWWHDVRFGCRILRSRPGFAAAAVLSIALGIGANTTIFSLVHGVLLAPLPYPHPERLAMIFGVPPNHPESRMPGTPRDYLAWKNQSQAFELVGMAVVADRDFGSEENGIPAENLGGWESSTSTLEILGARPELCRIFTPEEDQFAKGAPVLMISHALWQRRYGGDRNVIGKEVRLDGVPNTIIGVMPPEFGFWDWADYFKPNNFGPRALENTTRFVYTLARLKPGVSFAQAQAEMGALASQLAKTDPDRLKGWGVHVQPLREALYGGWFKDALLVTPGYFATMKIPLLQGRDFSETDTLSSPWVAVVSETMARRFWPNESAIGDRLTLGLGKDEMPREIVGIVADTPLNRRQTRPQPALFVSYQQQAPHWTGSTYHPTRRQMVFVVRSAGDPRPLLPAITHAAAEIEPDVPLTGVSTMEEYLGEQIDTPRYFLMVLGVMAVVATLLAVVGIYGVMAWSVAQRTREIGIRIALGAGPRDVLVGVLRYAFVLAVAGLMLGLTGSFALTRLIGSVLWGVTPTDPATFAGAATLLAVIALIAALVPALRAVRLDPIMALRHE